MTTNLWVEQVISRDITIIILKHSDSDVDSYEKFQ